MATKYQYARLANTAKRLIERFGNKEKIVGFVDVPNPDQPNRPGTRTPVEQFANSVFLNYESKMVDGTAIRSGDMKVLSSPLEATLPLNLTGTITRTDLQTLAVETWSIVEIKELNPGGIKLLYTLQVRK